MRSLGYILLVSVSAVSLSSCASLGLDKIKPAKTEIAAQISEAVPIAPQNEQTLARTWVEPSPDRLPTTDWVSAFNDPMLNDLVAEAMSANANIGAARARLQAAEASAASARSGLYPSIGVSGNASHTESANKFVPASGRFSLGGSVSWEVDMWGRVRDGANAGDLEAAASNADFAGVRLSVAGATTQTWLNLIEARLQTDLAQRNVATQERALRLTKRRFDGGVSGSSDYRLARSALANANATLAARQQSQAAITRALETLLRRYPENALRVPAALPQLPPLTSAGSPADVFLRRPDLLAAERRLQAAGFSVDASKKNLLPRLTLDASTNSGARSLSRLFNWQSLLASIGAGLTAPIFQGGALKATVARNEALLAAQMEAYADTALTAYREIENALDAEDYLRIREEALTISLSEAQKAEDRLEQRFSEGLASILQLLDAQTRRNNTEGQLISARKERLANRVRLHLALGGDLYGQEGVREEFEKPKLPSMPKLPSFSGL